MTLVAALLLAQAPTAADFFPLTPGMRRTYEERSEGETATYTNEVGGPTVAFDKVPATPIVQKSQFNQVIGTIYYQVVGPTVYQVGQAEERSESPVATGGSVDYTKPRTKRSVILALTPRMPVFKFDGKETTWTFGDVVYLKAEGEDPIKNDETAIQGSAKLGPTRTVLGRRVETLEVRVDVQLGGGKIGQKVVETSVYGRGIGLIEATRKIGGLGQKTKEVRTKLIGIEEAKDGG